MSVPEPVRSGAVVALKPIEQAKSRLGVPVPMRRQLAWTMAVDTLSVLSSVVDQVVVVSASTSLAWELERVGLPVAVLTEPGPLGLNGALSWGAGALQVDGCNLVLACVADLPALRAASVRRVLAAGQECSRSFVADASGAGSTMLLARSGPLEPHFQGPSAAAHTRSGAVPLTDGLLGTAVPDARRDVDTEADLQEAHRLGLGPATTALLARARAGAA